MKESDRQRHERKIEALLMIEFNDQQERGLSGWSQFRDRVKSVLAETLEEIYIAAAAALIVLMLNDQDSTELGKALLGAKSWATAKATKVAGDLAKNAEQSVRKKAKELEQASKSQPDAQTPPAGGKKQFAQLAAREVLTRDRAQSIAITETTGANSVGENVALKQVEESKELVVEVRWITEKDGKVCPICTPLHNKNKEVWSRKFPEGPPAHPNCRCDRLYTRRLRKRGLDGAEKIPTA